MGLNHEIEYAIQIQNLKELREAIKEEIKHYKSFDVDDTDPIGWTYLDHAIITGNVKIVNEILKYKPMIGHTFEGGNGEEESTSLILSVVENKSDIVEIILNYAKKVLPKRKFKKFINHRDSEGRSALFVAIQKNNPRIVQLLLHQKAFSRLIDFRYNEEGTLFDAFDEETKPEIVKLLLKVNDLAYRDPDGNTILHYASGKGYTYMVKEILKQADKKMNRKELHNFLNKRDINDETALESSKGKTKETILSFIRYKKFQKQMFEKVMKKKGIPQDVIMSRLNMVNFGKKKIVSKKKQVKTKRHVLPKAFKEKCKKKGIKLSYTRKTKKGVKRVYRSRVYLEKKLHVVN